MGEDGGRRGPLDSRRGSCRLVVQMQRGWGIVTLAREAVSMLRGREGTRVRTVS